MEGLRRTFFEDPLYVYIALGLAELVLIVIWHETRAKRWQGAMVIPVVLAAGVWGLARVVVTDREQIIEATHQIARDIEAGSTAVAEEFLDEDYHGFGGTKVGILAAGRAVLEAYPVQKVGFTRLEVTVDGQEASEHAGTIITVEGGKAGISWDVRWAKRPEGWRIIEVGQPQSRLEL